MIRSNNNDDKDDRTDFFKKIKSGTKNCYDGNETKFTKRTI